MPFNESTDVLGLPSRADQRHDVEAPALLTEVLDPSRPVVANDGWEAPGGDVIGVRDYDPDLKRLRQRYHPDALAQVLRDFGGAGRLLVLDDPVTTGCRISRASGRRPVPLRRHRLCRPCTHGAALGHDRSRRPRRPAAPACGLELLQRGHPGRLLVRYTALVDAVSPVAGLSGFCCTQFTSTYQEVNGLLRADRRPKVPHR